MFHIKGKSSFFPLYYNNILHVLRVFVKWLLPFLSQMIPISGIKKIFADAMNKASSKTADGTFSFFVIIHVFCGNSRFLLQIKAKYVIIIKI